MKAILTMIALSMALAGVANAQKDNNQPFGEGSICDINGCHQSTGEEDQRNALYRRWYGYNYDQGYRGLGERADRGGTGPGFGYGGGGAYLSVCVAKDYTGRTLAKVSTARGTARAGTAAKEICREKSTAPSSCRVSCR